MVQSYNYGHHIIKTISRIMEGNKGKEHVCDATIDKKLFTTTCSHLGPFYEM
jgi:hypothetical protein